MNNLKGKVLELFLKDKKRYNIRNVIYGKEAFYKFIKLWEDEIWHGDDKETKSFINSFHNYKLKNTVYFIYESNKARLREGISHRLITDASKSGEISYLGHLELSKKNTKRKPLKRRKKKTKRKYFNYKFIFAIIFLIITLFYLSRHHI